MKRYNKQISSIIESGLLGENGKLTYIVSQESLFDPAAETKTEETETPKYENPKISNFQYPYGAQKAFNSEAEKEYFVSNLYSKHTFENFVKGESNELAVAAAFAIANNPGGLYNPCLVYGGVGVGKTHLVQSIGNEIAKRFPEKGFTI